MKWFFNCWISELALCELLLGKENQDEQSNQLIKVSSSWVNIIMPYTRIYINHVVHCDLNDHKEWNTFNND